MTDIKLGVWYKLHDVKKRKTLIVKTLDGEDVGQPGISHGFIHYTTLGGEKGFCGTAYFEENATPHSM